MPDRQALLRAIEGNVCRCTGYAKIIAAIEAAQQAALAIGDSAPGMLRFTLNGAEVEAVDYADRTLLSVLREDFGLLGVKEGCSKGHCGSCSVLVDGEVVLSCRTPAGEVAGRSVATIEGIGTREAPHPLQRAFVEVGAVQCGFCTPGVIVAAKGLLDRNPEPTRDQIRAALNRNLCRCTGYVKLVEAVERAAVYLREAMRAYRGVARAACGRRPSCCRAELPAPGRLGQGARHGALRGRPERAGHAPRRGGAQSRTRMRFWVPSAPRPLWRCRALSPS